MRRRGGDDERPAVEIWGAEPDPIPTQRVEIGTRRAVRRPVVVAVVAVVGLLLAGLALDGGGDGGPDDAERSSAEREEDERGDAAGQTTSTTRTPRSTTTSPSTTVALGPPLGQPMAVDVLIDTGGRSWTWVQLDTGLRQEVRLEVGQGPEAAGLIGVRGGVVGVSDGGDAHFQPIPVGDPVSLGRASRVAPGPDDDSVWVVDVGSYDRGGDSSSVAQLVALDGSPIGPPVVVEASWLFGSTGNGLVFGKGGRVFEATADGVRVVASGELRAVARGRVAVYTCDDDATCWTEVIDTVSGTTTVIRADGEPFEPLGLSSAGWVARIDSLRQTLDLHDPSGALVGSVPFMLSDRWYYEQVVSWLPDGTTVLAPAYDGVELITLLDGEVVSTELPEDLDASQAVVIPR